MLCESENIVFFDCNYIFFLSNLGNIDCVKIRECSNVLSPVYQIKEKIYSYAIVGNPFLGQI